MWVEVVHGNLEHFFKALLKRDWGALGELYRDKPPVHQQLKLQGPRVHYCSNHMLQVTP